MSEKAHSRANVNPMNCDVGCESRGHCIEIKRIAALKRSVFRCPIVTP